jgi:rhodanese-related sulfurtransferase
MVAEISPGECAERLRSATPPVLLDVREKWELDQARLPDTLHIPLQEIPARLPELDRGAEIVVLCRSGVRSLHVARFLEHQGFRAYNLRGGILAWGREVDPTLVPY